MPGYTPNIFKMKIDNPLQGKLSFPPAVCPYITKASLFKRNTFPKCYQCCHSLPGAETPIMQTTDPTVHPDANEMARMIYFVSKAIGDEIAYCEGINLQPLNVCGQIELFHCKFSSSTKPILAVQTSLMRERSS